MMARERQRVFKESLAPKIPSKRKPTIEKSKEKGHAKFKPNRNPLKK